MDTLVLGIHVLLAAILVGPQFLLFFAVIPSTWLIEDEGLRRNVTRVVTQRFGMLSGISLAGLLLTGLYQLNSSLVDPDVRDHMMEFRYGVIFMWKMLMLVVLIILIGVHGVVFGRRIRAASEAVEAGANAGVLESARRASLLFSTLILLVSVIVLFLGVALANHLVSFEPR